MSFQPKLTSLQAYNMLLFRNALHPEFFGIEGRRRIDHGEYEFEAWIFRGGHALRFQNEDLCLSELVCEQSADLPEHGRCSDGLMSMWSDQRGKQNLSLLDTQRFADQVHVQSYHLRSDCGRVLRTQTIFRVKS